MVIRDFVRPVGKDAWVDLLKAGVVLEDYKPAKLMTTEDIKRLQQLTVSVFKKLPGNEGIVRKAIEAFHELEQKGLWLSDRRKVKILKICAASSILHLENEPTLDSLADALRLCAPHDEDDVHKVEEVIVSCGLSVLTPHIQKLKTLEAEIRNALKRAKAERSLNAIKDLLLIRKKALLALKDIPPSPRLYPYIHTLRSLIEEAGDFLDRDYVLEVLQK